jgi:hypothetical protein
MVAVLGKTFHGGLGSNDNRTIQPPQWVGSFAPVVLEGFVDRSHVPENTPQQIDHPCPSKRQ